jgi:hypothetical protein
MSLSSLIVAGERKGERGEERERGGREITI